MNKSRIARILGTLLLLIGLAGLYVVGGLRGLPYLGWFSHHVPILLGLALILRSRFLLTAEIAIGFIPESLWTIDLLGHLLTGSFPFGVTSYLFNPLEPMPVVWWAYSHLLIVPSMILGLWLLGGASRYGALGSLVHAAFLYFVPVLFITPDYNVNCVVLSCIENYVPTTSAYALEWWVVIVGMIALVSAFLMLFATPRHELPHKKRSALGW